PKKLADQRQAFATGETRAGEGMAQIMYPHVVQTGFAPDADPSPVEVRSRLIGPTAIRKQKFAPVGFDRRQELEGRRPKRYDLGPRLGISQAQQASIQIEL